MVSDSLLSYYQQNQFNPVPIALDSQSAWQLHFARRQNLYERHLGVPLSYLKDRMVVEFGCNSGENALVLASVGANLTLVEPNQQVWPRLRQLFRQFGLEDRITELSQEDIDHFDTDNQFDLVVAEGFLYTLPNRDRLVGKLVSLINHGGRAIISFNDRYGMLIEATKQLLLSRACRLAGIDDVHCEKGLDLAWQLYGQDYERLNASRPFAVWYKDTLINPFVHSDYLWSYPEILPLVDEAGGQFCSCSPQWSLMDHFTWYKDVPGTDARRQALLEEWAKALPFFLTGLRFTGGDFDMPSDEVISSVAALIARISQFAEKNYATEFVAYPSALDNYLDNCPDPRLRQFNSELKELYEAAQSASLEDLVGLYHSKQFVRALWGSPYHYLCFTK